MRISQIIVSIFFRRIFSASTYQWFATDGQYRVTCLHCSVKIEKSFWYLKNYEMWRVKIINKQGTFYERIKYITTAIIFYMPASFDNNSRRIAPSQLGHYVLWLLCSAKYSENIRHLVLIGCNVHAKKKKKCNSNYQFNYHKSESLKMNNEYVL